MQLSPRLLHPLPRVLLGACLAILSGSCQGTPQRTNESGELDTFFEEVFQERVDRSPEFQARLGIPGRTTEWDDISDAFAQEGHRIDRERLKELRTTFDYDALSEEDQLNVRLLEADLERRIAAFEWRLHSYPVNQMFGTHANVPTFLANMHRIESVQDAWDYVERLEGVDALLNQLVLNLEKRADMGILAPRFVYPMAIEDCKNVIAGYPFRNTEEACAILADLRGKLDELEGLADDERQSLEAAAVTALEGSIGPAYRQLIAVLERLEAESTTDDGCWKFPAGERFYEWALAHHTTTDMTAEEVHQLGLDEVKRIHEEMRAVMARVEYEGSLGEFFDFMRQDPQFYYANNEDGRERYLAEAAAMIRNLEARLDELFITKPAAPLTVRRVEAYREKSAGKAFYQTGTPDGSRPGVYYANLYDMADMPTYQMEALAYHEGTPGHHMQNSIAQELGAIPSFRKFGRYTAYGEGWGLYSEFLPKEFGFYEDPYSDFGRLAMELWRACRLVVDTGLHHKRWTREQAIDYLITNTPNPSGDCVKAIERYIVMPGQATAYKVGMLDILRLRAKARAALGERFDIRQFHEVVLTNGPVPLSMLEELVDEWVASELGGPRSEGAQ